MKFWRLIKGHNSGTNLRKMTCNNPRLDLVNINAYIKGVRALRGYFGPLWSQKLKNDFHQYFLIGFIRRITEV